MRQGPPLRVGPLRRVAPGRVELDVDGEVLWFTSDDVPLVPAPEAAASALVLAAALLERPLELAQPVDARFAVGMALLGRTVRRWWDCHLPRLPVDLAAPSLAGAALPRRRTGRTAACFTGGVDSFHLLSTHGRTVDDLLFVHGYDVSIEDELRAADTERRVRAVAADRGHQAIVVRTNLRQIGVVEQVDWGQVHGGALAAVAHLLTGRIGRLLIASSYSPAADRPWGSHWRTDRRWGSRRLRIGHVGQGRTRADKVAGIADDALAATHLQVCWQLDAATGNCGACPKCVVTMALLEHHGALHRFSGLQPAGDGDLAEMVAALPPSALYAPSLAVVARGSSRLAEVARAHLAHSPDPPPPTGAIRRLADRLGLP